VNESEKKRAADLASPQHGVLGLIPATRELRLSWSGLKRSDLHDSHAESFHAKTLPRLYTMKTEILKVDLASIGISETLLSQPSWIDTWTLDEDNTSRDAASIRQAAQGLRESDIPVAFPTETVYGLGADATRSPAVQGIYKAKQRPSDNPLIVHVWSLRQLRNLLRPTEPEHNETSADDPIPEIYTQLIARFWPGPLTLIVPNPTDSRLAPEVTAGLSTFGVRMPRNPHALALLKLADVPLAAPSANASTKPSPTEAEHVENDLNGRISMIIDGGPCDVGVESTVVDGLTSPPLILRPGGISIEQLRSCPGWEDVAVGYRDNSELNSAPRAPGMKYKHYSPKASVILFEHTRKMPSEEEMVQIVQKRKTIGVIRTAHWTPSLGLGKTEHAMVNGASQAQTCNGNREVVDEIQKIKRFEIAKTTLSISLFEIELGTQAGIIAKGLFAALRSLDKLNVDVILVEGVDDSLGDVSAAVMNRLRKAAEVKVQT